MTNGDFKFNTEIQVRLPETDALGLVYHGNYFNYLEVGRVDYLSNLGFVEGPKPIKDFDNVVVSSHLDFHSPARLHERLVIDVSISEIRKRSFKFSFRVRQRTTNAVIATGYTVHCAISEAFVPIPIPQHFREAIEKFEGHEL